MRFTARRTQAPEPTLTAFGLAVKRRAECARVNLPGYSVCHNVTDSLLLVLLLVLRLLLL